METNQIRYRDAVEDIMMKLGHFRNLIIEMSSKGEPSKDNWNEVMMFSPDEWETIAITIQQFDQFIKSANELNDKTYEERDHFLKSNKLFVVLVYNLSNHWYKRIEDIIHKQGEKA